MTVKDYFAVFEPLFSGGGDLLAQDTSRHPPSPPLVDSEALLGKVLAEFDGTTVLCRVCGDKASGFHYGVHSCEGCKGFFRRSIQQKIQYRPCTKNQQCSILRINRNRCQYCRLKKCISVGMSRDAVRFGRVPKREKAKILAAMQSVNARSQEKALIAELEDETKVINTIVRAHLDTCDFTKDKIGPMLQRALDNPSYTTCPSALACPLNPKSLPTDGNQHMVQDFSERFSPAIRGVVEFAKRLPGFALLSQEDQVTLLKSGVFEVLLVRLACMFDSQTNTMICLNGQVLKRESIQNSSNARFLMDSMFDFAERLNGLRLNDAELGLFCAIVVISADRPGLRNLELISRMQEKVDKVLRLVICQNHPQNPALYQELRNKIHDLRTLNTLHCEKLLAFKMTEQQQHWQQQQQLHQQEFQNHWGMEDGAKSPSWSLTSEKESDYGSPSSGYHPSDESVRSPLGSVSSEPVCTSELPPLHVINVHRSGKDLVMDTTHWDDKEIQHQKSPFKRKADSPNDSGMESTTEKSSSSANTSVCSSPRSSFDEKVREVEEQQQQQQQQQQTPERHEPVEDMPLLKQALQKPPLVNTDSILEKAYVPHKKFRALRRDSVERETTTTTSTAATGSGQLSQKHSTLAQRLLEGPKLMSEEQLKRSEAIHNMIMQGGGVETDRTVAYHHQHHPASAAAASATTCPMTRLPSTSGYYIPQSSGATPNNCWPFLTSTATISGGPSQPQTSAVPSRLQQQQHPEATLLTLTPVQPMVQPQPRISTMTSVPGPTANNTYYPHRTNGYHHHHPLPSRTPSSHTTQVVTLKGPPQLQAVVRKPIESSQPLNLSTKTPPPRPLEV